MAGKPFRYAKKNPQAPVSKGPTMYLDTTLPRLRDALELGKSLLASPGILTDEAHDSWELKVRHYLEGLLGENDSKVGEVLHAGSRRIMDTHWSQQQRSEYFKSILKAQVAKLGTVIELLAEDVVTPEELAAIQATAVQVPKEEEKRMPDAITSKKVFIVHGHDVEAKLAVARVIEKLKLEAVILHERPDKGRTIIEKLEAHSKPEEVAFAVVLLTPDDRGGTKETPFEGQKLRARENVLIELGLFVGKLGRDHVCALVKEGTTVPSDFQGVVYTPMDTHGAWKTKLAKEIKAAGIDVDLNHL